VAVPTKTYKRMTIPVPDKLNPEWTAKELAVAHKLLGTWKSGLPPVQNFVERVRRKQAPKSWTFATDDAGHLTVSEGEAAETALEPSAVTLEQYYGDKMRQFRRSVRATRSAAMSKAASLGRALRQKRDEVIRDFKLLLEDDGQNDDETQGSVAATNFADSQAGGAQLKQGVATAATEAGEEVDDSSDGDADDMDEVAEMEVSLISGIGNTVEGDATDEGADAINAKESFKSEEGPSEGQPRRKRWFRKLRAFRERRL